MIGASFPEAICLNRPYQGIADAVALGQRALRDDAPIGANECDVTERQDGPAVTLMSRLTILCDHITRVVGWCAGEPMTWIAAQGRVTRMADQLVWLKGSDQLLIAPSRGAVPARTCCECPVPVAIGASHPEPAVVRAGFVNPAPPACQRIFNVAGDQWIAVTPPAPIVFVAPAASLCGGVAAVDRAFLDWHNRAFQCEFYRRPQ